MAPLLFEVKQLRNVSKPYQRATDVMIDDEPKEQKIGPKKGQMYQMMGHDGVRFIKLVLLFPNQASLVSKMFDSNKFVLTKGTYFTRAESTITFLIDNADQIQEIWNDKKSPKLIESYFDIKGLPIKYTNAPRFKFITQKK